MKTLIIAALLLQAVAYAQPSDAYLKSRMDAEQIPGASMAIVKEANLIFMRSLGKADIAQNKDMNRHRLLVLSSVSNTITAMAVMQLWEKGLVQLDADINNYLPFQLVHPFHPNDTITLKLLLTHTAAIEDNWNILVPLFKPGDAVVQLDSFVKGYFKPGGVYYNMSGNFSAAQPGTQWRFSNMGATLAAYIVEQVTGDAYSHYCDTAIFDKLCMKNSAFHLSGIADNGMVARPYTWNGNGYTDNGLYGFPGYPGLMLRSSATDMARLMATYLNYGKYGSVRMLDSTTVAYMMQPHTPSLLPQTQALLYQGIGFCARQVGNGDTIVGQEGSSKGGIAAMYMSYKHKTGVLLLANSEGVSNPLLMMDTLYKYGSAQQPTAADTFPGCDESTRIPNLAASNISARIFPNPVRDCMYVRVPFSGYAILLNMKGQKILEKKVHHGDNAIAISPAIPAGIYIVQLQDDRRKVYRIQQLVYAQ